MFESRDKVGRVHVPVWTMFFAQGIGDTSSKGYLNSFDGIHDQKAQFPIENVDIQYVLEGDAFLECVWAYGRRLLLKSKKISGKTIVADITQIVPGFLSIRDNESACRQEFELFLKLKSWFAVGLFLLIIGHKNTRRGAHR